MRFRRRYLVLACASVAALTVGGTAVANHGPGNNTGVKCTATVGHQCQDNTSALPTWAMRLPANNSNDLPGAGGGGNGGSGATAPVKLDVQTASYYAHPNQPIQGGKIANVLLDFDNDVVFAANLGGAAIPSCTAAAQQGGGAQDTVWGSGTTIQEAWEDCGPGSDDGAGPEVNAYLSPPTTYSGTISTAPAANFPGCNLVFKRSDTSVTLFARATFDP